MHSRDGQRQTDLAARRWEKKMRGCPLGISGAVIHGERLLLNVGETGMAYDLRKTIWKSRRNAGYSTPVVFKSGKTEYAIFFGPAMPAVEIKTGKPWWSYRWLTRYGVNATDRIVTDDGHALISSGYVSSAFKNVRRDRKPFGKTETSKSNVQRW